MAERQPKSVKTIYDIVNSTEGIQYSNPYTTLYEGITAYNDDSTHSLGSATRQLAEAIKAARAASTPSEAILLDAESAFDSAPGLYVGGYMLSMMDHCDDQLNSVIGFPEETQFHVNVDKVNEVIGNAASLGLEDSYGFFNYYGILQNNGFGDSTTQLIDILIQEVEIALRNIKTESDQQTPNHLELLIENVLHLKRIITGESSPGDEVGDSSASVADAVTYYKQNIQTAITGLYTFAPIVEDIRLCNDKRGILTRRIAMELNYWSTIETDINRFVETLELADSFSNNINNYALYTKIISDQTTRDAFFAQATNSRGRAELSKPIGRNTDDFYNDIFKVRGIPAVTNPYDYKTLVDYAVILIDDSTYKRDGRSDEQLIIEAARIYKLPTQGRSTRDIARRLLERLQQVEKDNAIAEYTAQENNRAGINTDSTNS